MSSMHSAQQAYSVNSLNHPVPLKMEGITAFNARSRKKELPIHISIPAECFGTQSALDSQVLNHDIDLTTPSPPLRLRTSELNYSPMSKPFKDTRTTSSTPNKPKDTFKTRIPLLHGLSQDVAKPDQYVQRREEYGSFFSPTWCSSSGLSEQVSDHEATDEYRNHQVSKERQESHFSRDLYPDKWMLQLIDPINSQPLTCKNIARRYTAAFKHDIIAKTLASRIEQLAALDPTDQARVITSSANISLPPKKPTRSEFWATVMQAPADIEPPSSNPLKRKLATLIQDSENSVPLQTHARKDFWAIVMQTSKNEPASEKVMRNNSSGTTVRNTNSTSRKKRPRKERLVAAVQESAISTSSRKRPQRDFWAVCLE
ncbi:hypothetical protein BOTNAR_0338g00080 [Botryotinia narcissicola]|uniref:Uncharacterized protein n=1 Tax=Botryotinia narcissicola TaxID=278944 RepID=A0A4Z1HTC3_9HELO|nr:hypothetical protein BOTNAR_0338g00080 [Botryotinia narcissicola]